MFKMIIIGLMVLVFSGCATDKVYATGKVVYKGAKAVYIELPIQNDNLENIDNVVVSYDRVRTKVRDAIDESKKKVDANISSQTK